MFQRFLLIQFVFSPSHDDWEKLFVCQKKLTNIVDLANVSNYRRPFVAFHFWCLVILCRVSRSDINLGELKSWEPFYCSDQDGTHIFSVASLSSTSNRGKTYRVAWSAQEWTRRRMIRIVEISLIEGEEREGKKWLIGVRLWEFGPSLGWIGSTRTKQGFMGWKKRGGTAAI